MSNLYQRKLSLAGINVAAMSVDDLRALVRTLLDGKIHGVCFSPYVEGQGPGTQISAEQVRERLAFIQPYVHWIRTFSCSEGNELIPAIAKEACLSTSRRASRPWQYRSLSWLRQRGFRVSMHRYPVET